MYYLYVHVYVFYSSRRQHTRGALVTGVQTCALPIWVAAEAARPPARRVRRSKLAVIRVLSSTIVPALVAQTYPGARRKVRAAGQAQRSEERRVGKECVRTCRFRW